jgi:hypothetical protein
MYDGDGYQSGINKICKILFFWHFFLNLDMKNGKGDLVKFEFNKLEINHEKNIN